MQRLLNPNEVAQIDGMLHDNALLQACRKVWPERGTEVTSVVACAEDIFCEVAWLTDELIEADRDSDATSLTMGLWTNVTLDIARWGDQVSIADRYLIVSTVFRLVAAAFSLHWDSYYCDNLRNAMLENVEKKMPAPKDLHDSQEQQRQQEELLESIISCSRILSEWINDYTDISDLSLTDEIEMALNPSIGIKPTKPESRKADKKDVIIIRRERTVWRGKEITHSFDYRPKDISIKERNNRLSTFFNLLNKKYISHTEMNTFIDIFSGVETTEYIVWKRTIVELQYMLEQLINKQLITWTRPAPGKWQIASARFRHEHNSKEGRVIDSLVPDQFNKIPKKSKLKEHPLLDKIISILIPDSNAQLIKNEIQEMFAKAEIEEDDNNTQSQVKEVDY